MRCSAAPLLLVLVIAPSACATWRTRTAPAPEVVAPRGDGTASVLRSDRSVLPPRNSRVDGIAGEAGASTDLETAEVRAADPSKTGLRILVVAFAVSSIILLVGVAKAFGNFH